MWNYFVKLVRKKTKHRFEGKTEKSQTPAGKISGLQRGCQIFPSCPLTGVSLLTKYFFFRNQPIRNKNCLWRPCLLMDRDEMSSLYRGPSIDASYQVSVHLVEGFQRGRLKCEKLTDDGRQVTGKAHIAFAKVT